MYPESHLAITPQTLSYADMARRVPPSNNSQGITGANPSATSDQPLRSKGRRPVNNPPVATPATTSTARPRTMGDRDTSELDTPPKIQSQDGQVGPNIGILVLVILNSSFLLQPPTAADEARGKGNTTKPRAPEFDRAPSTHPSVRPSTPSAPALNQQGTSVSSSSPHAAALAMTRTESSWTRTTRGTRSGDLGRDPLNGGAPSESPHVRDEVKGSGYPNEHSHTMFSASSPRPPLSSEDTAPAVGSPSQPQTVSGPRSLGRSNSRIQEDEGAGRELTPDKERKPKTVSKEPESRQEDPATDTSRARRHKPEPTPPSSYTSPQSSIGRTYSSDLSRKNDFGVPPPRSDTSKLGGNSGHSSDSLPSSGVTQASFTPPVSLSLQNQPKHGIGTSPNNNPTSSSADPHSQLRTVASNSETHASPTLSRTTSSRASAPIARKTSREVRKEGETLSKPIPPPKPLPPVEQPSSTTLPPSSQKIPTGSSRDTGDDTFSRLPDNRHHGETPTSSVIQAGSLQEAVENKNPAKSSDRVGLVQSVGTSSFVSLIETLIHFLFIIPQHPRHRQWSRGHPT